MISPRIISIFVTAFVAFLCFLCVHAEFEEKAAGVPVSQTCLGCICEASSGCNLTVGCSGTVCGPFRITWPYWSDGGKPTVNNEPNTNEGAYPRCVNDPFCAARAVQGYMIKYGQDCNGDNVINCDDYMRIHRLGGFGCNAHLDANFENTYKRCMQMFT